MQTALPKRWAFLLQGNFLVGSENYEILSVERPRRGRAASKPTTPMAAHSIRLHRNRSYNATESITRRSDRPLSASGRPMPEDSRVVDAQITAAAMPPVHLRGDRSTSFDEHRAGLVPNSRRIPTAFSALGKLAEDAKLPKTASCCSAIVAIRPPYRVLRVRVRSWRSSGRPSCAGSARKGPKSEASDRPT